jgi:hypothetical protein
MDGGPSVSDVLRMSVDVQPLRREVALGNHSNEVKRFGTPTTAALLAGGGMFIQHLRSVLNLNIQFHNKPRILQGNSSSMHLRERVMRKFSEDIAKSCLYSFCGNNQATTVHAHHNE